LYASKNGLLTNTQGLHFTLAAINTGVGVYPTNVGIVLVPPTSTAPFMVVQMRI
jgi:hypothetical protein